ncbi:MAG: hypothetical protein NZ585_06025 [Chloracidobacterium sp.]|nr:hypothetical protein [Chloracidobacterium sp.]MDW8216139.1 hypothetical protein [Acidobacteriota bacterium]
MQVKSLTLTFPHVPEITWPKLVLQRVLRAVENTYHRIFGCWHTNMSRPFTINQETYRMCLSCGAHRAFDLQQWKMVGPYYVSRPPIETNHRPRLTVVQTQAAPTRSLRRAA